jgi:cytochrome c
MNFLDKFVIPSGAEHIALLNILQILTMLIFLPYMGMVLGGTVMSVYFNNKGKKENKPIYIKFAKDIIDKLLAKKSAGIGFVVLPIATITIIYSQFLMSAKIITVNFLAFSTLFYLTSLLIIYRYKISFLENIPQSRLFRFFRLSSKKEFAEGENNSVIPSRSAYAYLGLFTMFVGLFLFVCGTTVVSEPSRWNTTGILKSIFSLPVWLNYFYLTFASFAIAGGAVLYLFFVWQGGIKDIDGEYKNLVKNNVVPFTLISTMLQPLFLFGGIVLLPASAMSSSVYVYIVFAFLSVLIVSNLLFGIYKNSEMRFAGAVFFIMFLTFTFTAVKDQLVLGNSVKEHLYSVYQKSEDYNKQKSSLVITSTGVDAEQIYNQKCVACHKFDTKLVGPPYKETVPKYNGDVVKLAEYIFNPTKINPDYPAMPNQGLKKKEADAIAKWLIEKAGR